ncbi:cilia- and flagella- associated protein 210 isoform X2 [Bombina bombina]|uniref:cilia- and flagella- associated protein 210 isoform X2 n=1 Tax=Bombina bombina TaxID=8345 RepID=UPI00235ABE13|nr:cilia- and flagella- associated protein 210 isoform X2 [Bombina bombina]
MMATASAPVVQYGRRKGSSRVQSAEKQSEQVMINPVDLRQITVLPKAEWERIQNNVNTLEKEAREIYEEMKEREALHLRSKDIVKNWTNTIAGALLLTEVMKEREAQIELKNKRMLLEKNRDVDFVKRELEEGIVTDQKRALQQITARKKNTEDILKQIEEHKHAAELEKITEMKEGEEIRKLTRMYELEMNKLAQMKIEQKRHIMMDHLAHVGDKNFLTELEKQHQEAEDDKIRNFILAKKKLGGIRKAREEEINRLTVERRDQITEHLAAKLKEQQDDEDERIRNAVTELESKNKKESEEKEAKLKADIKAITEHRLAMRHKKEQEEREQKFKAKQELYAIKEADNLFITHEKEKMRRAEEEKKITQTMQIQQMAEKSTMSQLEKQAELKYAKQNEKCIAKEEEDFQKYAEQVIDSVTKAGRNPYPLKKAAQSGIGGGRGPVYNERGGIRPSYLVQDTSGVQLPAYQNDTTHQIKQIYDDGDIHKSKRKLGFTW